MSITDLGREGEKLARKILKEKIKVDGIFQADWIIRKDGRYYCVEVKHKDRFKAPPFDGHGLDVRQVYARMAFYVDTGIRCLFLVIDTDNTVLWQWLDVLEDGNKFTTKNGVRIYDIKGFKKLPDAV